MPTTTNMNTASRRRQTRLRREYLYRKSLEGQDKVIYEQKRQVREALANGKPLPTELRASYNQELKGHLDVEGGNPKSQQQQQLRTHMDDEYGMVGLITPHVCVTTSRDPSARLKQFAKEIKLLIPNSIRMNRGNHRVEDIMGSCRTSEFTDVILVQETRGEPDGLVICHLPLGPTAFFSLSNTVLRHDIIPPAAPMSESYPHLILDGFTTTIGQRVGNILKCLFPIPKPDSQRVITFSNDQDFISFRHHMYHMNKSSHRNVKAVSGETDTTSHSGSSNNKSTNSSTEAVQIHEVGPRFEMRLYQIRLGTLEQKEAENEYVLRPYQNTANKRNVL